MKPEMIPLGASGNSGREAPRFLEIALRAWRGITLRQWAWTTAIALLLHLAYLVGVLPAALNAVPNLLGRQFADSDLPGFVGAAGIFVVAAYCFLLAVSVAEVGAGHRMPPVRWYVTAGLGACAAAILFEVTLYMLVPSIEPLPGPLPLILDPQRLLGRVSWSATNFGLTGGLALAVYVRFRSATLAREAFNAAELERPGASREVLASRLAAMQARVEPGFLMGTLAHVEALYDRDPEAGDRMLDDLIAYLRAALPQLRSQRSTLQAEMQLAESYLRIMQIRMGSRLSLRIDVQPDLGDCDFPPMMLLPLVDNALRNGIEPSPAGGTIAITAHAEGDCVNVRIAADGLPRSAAANDGFASATLHERLRGLYGTAARLELIATSPQGVIAAIQVPFATARDHR